MRRQHLPVLVHHQPVRFLRPRQHLFSIFGCHQPRICVLVDRGRGAFAQRQRNPFFLLPRALDVGSGCRHIPLIAIEERNLDGHFCNSFPAFRVRHAPERFVVVLQPAAQLHIRNRSAPGLHEHTLSPPLRRLGDSNRRTFLRNRLHHLFLVQFRPVFFQVSRHRRHGHFRLPDHCRKRPPFLSQSIFLHPRTHPHALRFHFHFQHFAFVRLSRVHQPPLGFGCILRNFRHIPPRIEQLLRRQHAQERDLHRTLYSYLLLLRFQLRQFHFLSKNISIQSQFSARNDRLLHKESLLSAPHRSASNFIPRVSHRRIRIEPRLLLARLRRANFRFGLPQSRIRFARDLLRLLQRDELPVRAFLRSSKSWVFRLDGTRSAAHRVLLLGHLHLLCSRGILHQQCARDNQHSQSRLDSHVLPSSSLCPLCLCANWFYDSSFCSSSANTLAIFFFITIASYSLPGRTRTIVIIPIIPALQFFGIPSVSGFSTTSSIPISMNASCGNPGTLDAFGAIGEGCTCSKGTLFASDIICPTAFSSVWSAV